MRLVDFMPPGTAGRPVAADMTGASVRSTVVPRAAVDLKGQLSSPGATISSRRADVAPAANPDLSISASRVRSA
ncbi:MAG: hypothetical protein M1370_11000 [Bacteroidetes bacterium]|nr:hypothetical protein [Bacteroidota bacterium]MCL5027127.1 hypothetical protein [Chloroflexota bacterium]